jgi:hypothetical protein
MAGVMKSRASANTASRSSGISTLLVSSADFNGISLIKVKDCEIEEFASRDKVNPT